MSKSETIPVQIEAEKLCKHTLTVTNNLNNFPKKYRFTLVDRIVRISFGKLNELRRKQYAH